MREFTDISVVVQPNRVGVVEINRPPSNYFDVVLIEALADAFEMLASRDDCRVIVLCSEGKHFCAGADFAQRSGLPSTDRPISISTLYEQGARLFRAPLPVVAAVQGAAVGGGLGLACAADFRVACAEARFAANFARLGFHQGFALSVSLPPIVGQQRALDMLYSGRRVTGTEAFEMGLCDRLVPQDEVRSVATAWAAELATSAPLAVRSIRATMRRELLDALDGALRREWEEQERLRTTADFREGVRSVNERREPNFEGR
jgi:2-(1,2-epoxy-1,2-dihydrophenyl)acetyl-CoA isomerase